MGPRLPFRIDPTQQRVPRLKGPWFTPMCSSMRGEGAGSPLEPVTRNVLVEKQHRQRDE
jgi:hypothetical protein